MDIIKTIPDKIYVANILEESASNDRWGLWSGAEVESTMNIEYIRKDALAEWIQTELKSCEGAAAMTRAYHKLIDKLSSL